MEETEAKTVSYSDNRERERILWQALNARSLSEIETAECELRQWVCNHPDDLGIVDAFEPLAIMREIEEEKARAKQEPVAS
jgi:hypothetical protein